MQPENIEQLFDLLDLYQLKTDSFRDNSYIQHKRDLSYLISYPSFIAYFSKKKTISKEDLILAGNFAYAWMPTVLVWKTHNFDLVVDILNKVKNSRSFDLSIEELESVKALVNGSVVGMSKVLHFINPYTYPIWDLSLIHI